MMCIGAHWCYNGIELWFIIIAATDLGHCPSSCPDAVSMSDFWGQLTKGILYASLKGKGMLYFFLLSHRNNI